jgi:hypothetical protein
MFGLGRRPAVDPRDRRFSMRRAEPMIHAVKRYDRVFYRTPAPLNQGNTSQCVEFAWQLFLGAFPVYGALLPRTTIYDLAQQLDEFSDTPPGDGTSVRAGAKALQSLGHITHYVWTESVRDIQTWMQAGAGIVVVGTVWYNSMFTPGGDGKLRVDAATGEAGGHAWPLVGFDPQHRFADNTIAPAYRMQNSWGAGWGQQGRAWITESDLQFLIDNGGEICCGVESLADAPK